MARKYSLFVCSAPAPTVRPDGSRELESAATQSHCIGTVDLPLDSMKEAATATLLKTEHALAVLRRNGVAFDVQRAQVFTGGGTIGRLVFEISSDGSGSRITVDGGRAARGSR